MHVLDTPFTMLQTLGMLRHGQSLVMSWACPFGLLAAKAVSALWVHNLTTHTLVWLHKLASKPQTHCHPQAVVVQFKPMVGMGIAFSQSDACSEAIARSLAFSTGAEQSSRSIL